MANDTGLTKLACKTAEKFLDALALWNAHWAGDYLPEEWLFRGHANAAWDLYPKAFRARTVLRTPEGWGTLPAGVTNQEQILAEFQTIKLFFKLADGFCVFLFSASLRSRSMVCLNLVISLASSPMRSEASRSFAFVVHWFFFLSPKGRCPRKRWANFVGRLRLLGGMSAEAGSMKTS